MKLRWPIRRRWTWAIFLVGLYGLFVGGLAIALPYQPQAVIELQWSPEQVILSHDGSTLAAASGWSEDGKWSSFGVFDTSTGRGPRWTQADAKATLLDVANKSRAVAFQVARAAPYIRTDESWPIYLWYPSENRTVELDNGLTLDVRSARFSPDGSIFAYKSKHEEYSLTLWDVESHRPRLVIKEPADLLCFSRDSRWLAATLKPSEKVIKVWDARTGEQRAELHDPPPPRTFELESPGLAFSRDGSKLCLYGHGYFCLWDAETGIALGEKILAEHCTLADFQAELDGLFVGPPIDVNPDHYNPEAQIPLRCPFTEKTRTSVSITGCDMYVTMGNPMTIPLLSSLQEGLIRYAKPDPTGKFIVLDETNCEKLIGTWDWLKDIPFLDRFASADRSRLDILDVDCGQVVGKIHGQRFECFSADGRSLVTRGDDSPALSIWDLPPRKPWLRILGGAAIPITLIVVTRWLLYRRATRAVAIGR